ncbi:rabenosyn-5 [Octopus bimaculoides]|uniref:FYVE-type domain-containing protein n=1 Tax=Octopus bimaculoides TaxID=37653 RepID=A0A0L8I5T7_OCTBM|nr:rabenosyn-5 [Octopus bimaculoides]|eukprot:XP_014790585.1 PREDICTED: rabenosyn-5-like [Octopus bimaculoides]
MTSTDIREGFICPICLKDYSSVTQLQTHFEDAHTTEEKAVSQQLKGLFEKAKKRLLGDMLGEKEDSFDDREQSSTNALIPGLYPFFWEPQEIGISRSHTETFKAIRDARVDRFVIETNKLLIRLDKLISPEAPTDPNKRKVFEKTVVPWVNDADVPMCPSCARTFIVTRRRHHCRLCGGIVCDRCSHFMSFSFAKKLTDPAFNFQKESGFLKRSGSDTSLNSMFSAEGEQHIRTCLDCRRLLERRDSLVEQRNLKPVIVQLYEKLRTCIEEAEQQLPRFLPMVESLSNGESTYSLNEANQLRCQLLKLYEYIDIISKKILTLGVNNETSPPLRQLYLQRAIRTFSSNFLKENLSGIQQLPSQEEYEKMKNSHTVEMQQKFALERKEAMLAQEQEQQKSSTDSSTSSFSQHRQHHSPSQEDASRTETNGNIGKGWKPSEISSYSQNTNDPMLQQIEIICGYIKQAKQAQKFDEVEMLEQNLQELQLEYNKQNK